MPDQPSPRRRFQFRLRTLFIVVMLVAVACGYVAWQKKIVGDRKSMVKRILDANAYVFTDGSQAPIDHN